MVGLTWENFGDRSGVRTEGREVVDALEAWALATQCPPHYLNGAGIYPEAFFGRVDHKKAAGVALALRFFLHEVKKEAALYRCIQVARRVLVVGWWDELR